jgi:glycosyltransferase involved in cell wall biosynthesis
MAVTTRPQTELTLCLMVKNEEKFLAGCIESALGACSRVIVADTGSTDRTMEVARSFTDEVHAVPFTGDFGAARNSVLDRVDGGWVLFLDADERLCPGAADLVPRVLADVPEDVVGLASLRNNLFAGGGFASDYVVRLFRSRPEIRYHGIVGESIADSVTRAGGRLVNCPLTINHLGAFRPQAVRYAKARFYQDLLDKRLRESPNDADLLSRYAMTLKKTGALDEAMRCIDDATRLDPDSAFIRYKRGYLLRAMGRMQEALRDFSVAAEAMEDGSAGRSVPPSPTNMVGVMELTCGLHDRAEATFHRARRRNPLLTAAVINLGLVAQARADFAAAATHFDAAARENPAFMISHWDGLLEADPFEHLDNDTILRFRGLAYHRAYCRAEGGNAALAPAVTAAGTS